MAKINESRRKFVKNVAATIAGITIIPDFAVSGLGKRVPSDKLNIVGIGVGGKGYSNLVGMHTENIVGLCDVDWKYSEHCFKDFPKAKRYQDWRGLFEELGKSIDGVMIATADHTHAQLLQQPLRWVNMSIVRNH